MAIYCSGFYWRFLWYFALPVPPVYVWADWRKYGKLSREPPSFAIDSRQKKRGGAQCVESSNIKGVTQFKNLNTLCSHNLKRINLTDILHRCPYMWNCSNDRGSIFGRGCNFFYHSTHTVCVCVFVCGRGESTLPSVKAYRGLCALC